MLELVPAVLEDAEAITMIKIRAYHQEINYYLGRDGGPDGYDKVESEEWIIRQFEAFKIMQGKDLIGAFFVKLEEQNTVAYLEDFVIDLPYQNKGFGFETLKLVEKAYPDALVWKLSTPIFSIGNQHLYEKAGYHEVVRDEEEIYYEKT